MDGGIQKTGGPINTIFTFEAKSGNQKNAVLHFVYKRSWEISEADKTVDYSISIISIKKNKVNKLTVKENETFTIKLKKNGLTSKWFLDNKKELNGITLINVDDGRKRTHKGMLQVMVPAKPYYTFTFKAGKATEKPILLEFYSRRTYKKFGTNAVKVKYEITIVN